MKSTKKIDVKALVIKRIEDLTEDIRRVLDNLKHVDARKVKSLNAMRNFNLAILDVLNTPTKRKYK